MKIIIGIVVLVLCICCCCMSILSVGSGFGYYYMQEDPVDCSGSWTEWKCDKECGDGTATRTFEIDIDAEHGGDECDNENKDKETKPCKEKECPVDCEGKWDEWSKCNEKCGPGKKTRNFKITKPAKHGGKACEKKNDYVDTSDCQIKECLVDCVGSWGKWTDCSCNSGIGTKSMKYTITKKMQFGGKVCDALNGAVDTSDCSLTCPVDCSGTWSTWTDCSGNCDSATKTRTFTITTDAKNGGKVCDALNGAVDTSDCSLTCPVDCSGTWSTWTDCSGNCDSATKTRTFTITTDAKNGGKECINIDKYIDNSDCALDFYTSKKDQICRKKQSDTLTKTKDGKQCIFWENAIEYKHLDDNFCVRDPNDDDLWCYTNEAGSWALC